MTFPMPISPAMKHAATHCFSSSYKEARQQFLDATHQAGLPVQSHIHPLKGRDGEELAMDVVRAGSRNSERMLIISSACHGVEGYCGSGVQVALMQDPAWHAAAESAGVALLYIHALNPHGFSYMRRVTHENVDLNRNFQDFAQPLPHNPDYEPLHHRLMPDTWPPSAAVDASIQAYKDKYGNKAYQAAVTRGQYTHADGLFYGGTAPTWSNTTVRGVLKEHTASTQHLAWIDLHTGLGPNGLGERIYAGIESPEALKRARKWWGNEITSTVDGSSSSVLLTGLMWQTVAQDCPQAVHTGIAMEYGTLPINDMINALRADHWLAMHPEASEEQHRAIKAQILGAFYTNTDHWREQILAQAFESAHQAVAGLHAS